MKNPVHVKSYCRSLLVLLMGFFLVASLFTGSALADRSLFMEEVTYEAKLQPDATAQVTETYTIDFNGQWNGFYRYIPIGDTPIEDVVVSENGQAYEFNPGTEYGPPGTYLVKEEGDSLLIDWSIDAEDETRTFTVTYRLINAVKIHEDTAEFYRKFVGDENQQGIQRVSAAVTLPPEAGRYKQGEDIKIWGHGPIEGVVEFADSNRVIWEVNDLSAGTFMEGRVVMPTALFPDAPPSAHTNQTMLPTITAEEQEWAAEADRRRGLARWQMGGAIGAVLLSLIISFFCWFKFGRKHPVAFDGEYYRELPAHYSPGELASLWNFGTIKGRDLTATILDLARRKYIRIDEEIVEKDRFLFGTKKDEAYRLTFLPPPDPASLRNPEEGVLRPHEQKLLAFLRDTVARGKGYLYLHEIEDFAGEQRIEMAKFWKEWTDDLKVRGDELNFFENNARMIITTVLLGMAMIGTAVFLFSVTNMDLLGVGLIISGIITVILPLFFRRRTPSGQEQYAKWKAFRRFLEDFSQMETHEIPSLVIWEHFLVYAVTLGVAKEVIKQLQVVFPNLEDNGYRFGYGWYYMGAHGDLSGFPNSFDSFSESIENSIKAAVSTSSSSGGGGGFSGGGGGGGGGGGFGGR